MHFRSALSCPPLPASLPTSRIYFRSLNPDRMTVDSTHDSLSPGCLPFLQIRSATFELLLFSTSTSLLLSILLLFHSWMLLSLLSLVRFGFGRTDLDRGLSGSGFALRMVIRRKIRRTEAEALGSINGIDLILIWFLEDVRIESSET